MVNQTIEVVKHTIEFGHTITIEVDHTTEVDHIIEIDHTIADNINFNSELLFMVIRLNILAHCCKDCLPHSCQQQSKHYHLEIFSVV